MPTDSPSSEQYDWRTIYQLSRALTKEEAAKLEEKVKSEPSDVMSRAILVSYYARSRDTYRMRNDYIFWLIKNKPNPELFRDPAMRIHSALDPEGYAEARTLLLKQVDDHPKDLRILAVASGFLFMSDIDESDELTRQLCELDPGNYEWPQQLGRSYYYRARRLSGEERSAMAHKSLIEYEKALNLAPAETPEERVQRSLTDEKLSPEEQHRLNILSEVANAALEAEELSKSKRYAKELIDLGTRDKLSSRDDDAVHAGHTILGRISMRNGDVVDAKNHLLASANVKGSPVLASFGPSMVLAKELLEKNERDTVIEYLHLCALFWTHQKDLGDWEETIRKGEMPDFGMSLR